MVGTIAKKELVTHLVSFRFWVGALVTLILAAATAVVAARDFDQRLGSYQARAAAAKAELARVTVYSYLQPEVIRRPEPLSILDQGFDARFGTAIKVHLLEIPTSATGGERGNELLSWLRSVDLTILVSVILGLLALLLAADSLAVERADGSLRLALAHGGSRAAILAGKYLGGLVAVCLPLAGAIAVSLAALQRSAPEGLSPRLLLRVAALAGVYGAYLSLMVLIGLVISLLAPTAARALQAAALAWMLLFLILPDDAAWTSVRAGSGTDRARRAERQQKLRAYSERSERYVKALRRSPMLGESNGHSAPVKDVQEVTGAVRYRLASGPYYDALLAFHRADLSFTGAEARRTAAYHREVETLWKARERWAHAIASLSPAFLLGKVSESLAGTSVDDFARFLAAGRAYRETLSHYLEAKGALLSWRWLTDDPPENLRPWTTLVDLRPEEVDEERSKALRSRQEVQDLIDAARQEADADRSRRLDLEDLPPFSYAPVDGREALRRVAPEAALLLLWNAAAAGFAWFRFRRFEIG
jgi:ABC-2 type transport system permease protein